MDGFCRPRGQSKEPVERFSHAPNVFFERPLADALQAATPHFLSLSCVLKNTLNSGPKSFDVSSGKDAAIDSIRD
jgi:hypothetical protein